MRKQESVVQESLEKLERKRTREGKGQKQNYNKRITKDYGSKLCKGVQKGKGRIEGKMVRKRNKDRKGS